VGSATKNSHSGLTQMALTAPAVFTLVRRRTLAKDYFRHFFEKL